MRGCLPEAAFQPPASRFGEAREMTPTLVETDTTSAFVRVLPLSSLARLLRHHHVVRHLGDAVRLRPDANLAGDRCREGVVRKVDQPSDHDRGVGDLTEKITVSVGQGRAWVPRKALQHRYLEPAGGWPLERRDDLGPGASRGGRWRGHRGEAGMTGTEADQWAIGMETSAWPAVFFGGSGGVKRVKEASEVDPSMGERAHFS